MQSEGQQQHTSNAFLSTALTHPSGRKKNPNAKELQSAREAGSRRVGEAKGLHVSPECTHLAAKGFSVLTRSLPVPYHPHSTPTLEAKAPC